MREVIGVGYWCYVGDVSCVGENMILLVLKMCHHSTDVEVGEAV